MESAVVKMERATVESLTAGWEQKKELATVLLKSKFLPAAFTTPEQVIAVMLKGQELNIPPMEALSSINVIQGKPTVSPQLMLALVRRTGELENFQIEKGASFVTVITKRRGQSPVSSTFGQTEANALNLSGKDNYKKQAHVMYQWRAIAANLRLTFPDVICGMYTPEEMGAEVIVDDEQNMTVIHTQTEETHLEQQKDVANGVSVGREFDPSVEVVERGKHAGSLWAQVPLDYLNWASGQKGDLKVKADATLVWLKLSEASKPVQSNVVDEMFPETPLIDILESELTEVLRSMDSSKLVEWGKQNKDRILTLSKKEQDMVRKTWEKANKEAKKSEATHA